MTNLPSGVTRYRLTKTRYTRLDPASAVLYFLFLVAGSVALALFAFDADATRVAVVVIVCIAVPVATIALRGGGIWRFVVIVVAAIAVLGWASDSHHRNMGYALCCVATSTYGFILLTGLLHSWRVRLEDITELAPGALTDAAAAATVVSGVFLVVLGHSLKRRKRRAWRAAVLLLVVSIGLHALKLEPLSGLVSLIGLVLLLRYRRALVWGFAYLLIWENFIAQAGNGTARMSILSYARSVLSAYTGAGMKLADRDLTLSFIVPLVVGVAAIAYTARRLHHQDID